MLLLIKIRSACNGNWELMSFLRITPIPILLSTLGTLNLRGRVIWVTLGQFLETNCFKYEAIKFRSLPLKIKTRWWVWQLTRCREWLDVKKMLTNVSDSVAPLQGEWYKQTHQRLRL